jgi:general secretion pathway protein I
LNDARPRRGFTLIEVLVALIIVAFGMSAVFVSLTSAANSTMRLREKSLAEWVGFNQLSTVRLNGTAPVAGRSEGDATLAGIRWHCLQTVENMDVPGLLRITIQVRYADAQGGKPVGSQGDAGGSTLTGSAGDAGNVRATSRCIDPTASIGGTASLSSTTAVSSTGTSVLSGAANTGTGATWLATVVGFYGVGTLLTAPQGLLPWDAAAGARSATPPTPGSAPAAGTTPPPTGTTTLPPGAPAPAPVPAGPGLP